MSARMPLGVVPVPGESLESWIEATCEHAGLSAAAFFHATSVASTVGAAIPTGLLGVKLDRGGRASLHALTGVPPEKFAAMTLERFDGTALDLRKLDTRSPNTLRAVAAKRWAFWAGTRMCPACMKEQPGRWRIEWRLPWVMVCPRHELVLSSRCPSCRRPYRSEARGGQDRLHPRRSSTSTCGNPVDGHRCEQPTIDVHAADASLADLELQRSVDEALAGAATRVGDAWIAPAALLDELRCLAALIIHIAEAATNPSPEQAELAFLAQSERLRGRVHRWHLSPPRNAAVMLEAVALAHGLLTGDGDEARSRMAEQFARMTMPTAGLLAWAGDHTAMTPMSTRIVLGGLSSRRRLGAALHLRHPQCRAVAPDYAITQAEYVRSFSAALPGVTPEVGRRFIQMCLARQAGANTWAEAEQWTGLAVGSGVRSVQASTRTAHANFYALEVALDSWSTTRPTR